MVMKNFWARELHSLSCSRQKRALPGNEKDFPLNIGFQEQLKSFVWFTFDVTPKVCQRESKSNSKLVEKDTFLKINEKSILLQNCT